jgi:replicative DNA helicase
MAERALLGALLSNNKAIEMCEGLRSEMFADAVNGRVFTAILRRISVGRIADAVSLKDDFENSETLEEVGSTKYLSELLGSMVAIINAKKYARAIRNLYMRRQLIDIGGKLVNKAFGSDEPELDATQIALTAVAEIDAIIDGSDHAGAGVKLHEAISDALQAINDAIERKGPVGVPTGFRCIDRRLGGLEAGTLTVTRGARAWARAPSDNSWR